MRVRLLVDISGTRNGVEWPARGQDCDLPDDEAAAMIHAGLAAAVGIESAAVEPPETATTPKPRARRG